MDYESLLKHCRTEAQREAVEAVIECGDFSKASRKLGKHRTTISDTVALVQSYSKEGPNPFGLHDESVLYSVKDGEYSEKLAWVKRKKSREEVLESVEKIIESLKIPKFKPVKTPRPLTDDMMNVYVFGDPHIDMLSWEDETGQNWDLDIAIHNHMSAIIDMVDRSPKCDTGVLATLGDLFHRDSLKALTPGSGNIVDIDGRLGRSWDRGVELIRAMIDRMLKKYQKVIYACIRGNHSETLELVLSRAIRIAYENNDRVEILDNTSKDMPLTFGKNFLLFVHGDNLNIQKKAGIVTAKYRARHGNAVFSHVISGHLHHKEAKEYNGAYVEIFPVLCPPDAWHNGSGYVTSMQEASVLTYHKMGGIINRTQTNPIIFLK